MIISPLDSTLVNKTIKIIGTATDPHFALYQVSYGIGWNPQNWILIKESDIPVIEDVLAEWHTDLLDDGRYTIRLLVKDLVNNEKEDRVLLIVGEPQYSFEITGFNKCEGVAVDEAGYIYVADRNSNPIPQHNRIAKFDPYGHLILNIFDVRKPNGVDVDDSGNIYASEWAGDCVTKFSPAGDSLMTIIGFNKPKGVAVDRLYQIYVADRNNNRVVRCDPQGNFNLVIENLGHPKGVDADNLKIYSTDTNTGKIKIFDQGGNPLFEFGEGLNQPSDVEVDSRGYIWVVDRNNNRILCYDFFGNRLLDFGTIGSGPGEFNKPEGVAVSEIADGVVKEVFVADRNNDRVCKFIIPYLISYQAGIMGPSLGSPELEITEAVAYPSPYDPNKGLCRIRAILTTEADAKLTIYTLSGRVVYRDEIFSGLGIVEFVWDGRNEIGEMVNNGVYGFLIQARNETESKEKEGKFIVLKH
jgi:streptogramin lyase